MKKSLKILAENSFKRLIDYTDPKIVTLIGPMKSPLLKKVVYNQLENCTNILAEKFELNKIDSQDLKETQVEFASEEIQKHKTKTKANISLEKMIAVEQFKHISVAYHRRRKTIMLGESYEKEILNHYFKPKIRNLFVQCALASELGHKVASTRKPLSISVEEFYDTISEAIVLEQNYKTFLLEHLFPIYQDGKEFFEYWLKHENKGDIKLVIENFEKTKNKLFSNIKQNSIIDYTQVYGEPGHEGGQYIFIQLYGELRKKDFSEDQILTKLAKIAGKAIYNPTIDFSNTLTFIPSLKAIYLS